MRKTWIAHKADAADKLLVSREDTLALTKIQLYQETGISKTCTQSWSCCVV